MLLEAPGKGMCPRILHAFQRWERKILQHAFLPGYRVLAAGNHPTACPSRFT
jgi:hypothetical protein